MTIVEKEKKGSPSIALYIYTSYVYNGSQRSIVVHNNIVHYNRKSNVHAHFRSHHAVRQTIGNNNFARCVLIFLVFTRLVSFELNPSLEFSPLPEKGTKLLFLYVFRALYHVYTYLSVKSHSNNSADNEPVGPIKNDTLYKRSKSLILIISPLIR